MEIEMPKGKKGFQKGHPYFSNRKKMTKEERKKKESLYKRSPEYRAKSRIWAKNRYKRKEVQEKIRNRKLQREFGITLEEYKLLHQKQHGLCAICCKPEIVKQGSKIRDLAVDHNHETGQVRGLLCNKCNIGIGVFLEDILLFEKAKDYLVFHNGDSI